MDFLKKYWGSIAAIAGPLLAFLEPSIHVYAAQHPHTLVAVVMGALLIFYHSKSPKEKQ